jgi:hypothetical protein
MIFKYRAQKKGGHYHTSVYSAKEENMTFAKLGDLILDERDFEALKSGVYTNFIELIG